jgi:Cof subfamily protein (haloacid dehalogenase superfamily)
VINSYGWVKNEAGSADEASLAQPKGILALDIDGTLTGPDGSIGERTLHAVHAAGESGWIVTIATGRSWAGAKPVADQLGLRLPIISYNGALVRDSATTEILHYIPLSHEIVGSIVPALVEFGLQPMVIEDIREGERTFTGPPEFDGEHTGYWLDHIQKSYQTTVVRLPYDELANVGHAVNIVVYDALEPLRGIDAIARGRQHEFRLLALDGYDKHADWVYFLHPSGTKAYALQWLARQYGLTMADVIAVGDGVNDIEMLAEAGFGVAMGNATERVQREAELVIGHHLDEGLASFIEEHLLHVAGVPELRQIAN